MGEVKARTVNFGLETVLALHILCLKGPFREFLLAL